MPAQAARMLSRAPRAPAIWCHMALFYAPGEVGVPWAAASTATAISQARPLTRRRALTRHTVSIGP